MKKHIQQLERWGKDDETHQEIIADMKDSHRWTRNIPPRSDEIQLAWQLMDPVLQGWAAPDGPRPASYKPGSWGPVEADELLARDGRAWRIGCGGH